MPDIRVFAPSNIRPMPSEFATAIEELWPDFESELGPIDDVQIIPISTFPIHEGGKVKMKIVFSIGLTEWPPSEEKASKFDDLLWATIEEVKKNYAFNSLLKPLETTSDSNFPWEREVHFFPEAGLIINGKKI